jgi:hypothetical protein
MPIRCDDHPMIDRDAPRVRRRRGGLIVVVVLFLGAAAALGAVLWPDSMKDRENKAVDACKTAIDLVAPSTGSKVWQASTIQVHGSDKDHLTVTGSFYTGSTSAQAFTCVVDHKVVTNAQVAGS